MQLLDFEDDDDDDDELVLSFDVLLFGSFN